MDNLTNKKLLIIDDEDSNLFALKSYLETIDVEIIIVNNGKEAVDFLAGEIIPDVILLDMMMPVMDGYETLRVLNEKGILRRIPVIAVTARAMKGDREKCLEAGAWDYISKPLDMNLLINKMSQLLK